MTSKKVNEDARDADDLFTWQNETKDDNNCKSGQHTVLAIFLWCYKMEL